MNVDGNLALDILSAEIAKLHKELAIVKVKLHSVEQENIKLKKESEGE